MGVLYDLASKEQEALIKKINRYFKTKNEKEWNEWEERMGIMKKPIEIIFEFTAEFKHEVEPMEGGNMDKIMSPGKYSMRFGASDVEFDFKNTCYTIYDSKHIAKLLVQDMDYDAFPESKRLQIKDLENVTRINEIFVYSGEDREDDQLPQILSAEFIVPFKGRYPISKEVLMEYNERIRKGEI